MNYFVKHWRGQFSVAKAFWPWLLCGWLIGLLELVVSLNTDNGLEQLFPLFTRINLLIFVPSGIWWGCGVWRSCDNAKKRTNSSNIFVKSFVGIFFFEVALLISWIVLEPVSNFFPEFLYLHFEDYEIGISPYLIAQALLLIATIGFVIYIKLFRRRWRWPKPLTLSLGCVLAVMLFWGGWNMLTAPLTLPSVKECPAETKNCNPFDTPENRAIFDKKKTTTAPASK